MPLKISSRPFNMQDIARDPGPFFACFFAGFFGAAGLLVFLMPFLAALTAEQWIALVVATISYLIILCVGKLSIERGA